MNFLKGALCIVCSISYSFNPTSKTAFDSGYGYQSTMFELVLLMTNQICFVATWFSCRIAIGNRIYKQFRVYLVNDICVTTIPIDIFEVICLIGISATRDIVKVQIFEKQFVHESTRIISTFAVK